jgi:hypothetical protein
MSGTRKSVMVDVSEVARFDRAFELLRKLVDLDQADMRHPVRGNADFIISRNRPFSSS